MLRAIFAACLFFCAVNSYCQRERIHLDFDKYSCKSGDTVWFKAVVFKGQYPTNISTNLYVELLTGKGLLLKREVFPLFSGQGMGQIIIPDSIPSGNYYVVALTRQQLNYDTTHFFSVPILVYNKEKPGPVHHKKQISDPAAMATGSIKGVYWMTTLFQGKLASTLQLDSGTGASAKNWQLVKPISGDSILAANINLDDTHPRRYGLFPVDSSKDTETLLLYEDSTLIGRQVLQIKDHHKDIKIIPDTLDTSPGGYNSWQFKMPDSAVYFTSTAVLDADRSVASPASIERLNDSYTDNLAITDKWVDTSYITFTGKAGKQNYLFGSRKIKDPFSRDILMTGVRDSNFVFMKTVRMNDEGNFILDSLFFFDSLSLQFQINKPDDGSTKNIKLSLTKFIPPPIDSSCFSDWVDDEKPVGKLDTLFTQSELAKYELSKMKTLKPVVVTHFKSPRKELDNRYTTGAFSEPSMYSFDVRTETGFHDIGSYLRQQMGMQGGFSSTDTPSLNGHEIVWFVDEQCYSWPELQMFDWERIAYIKVLQSDFLIDDPFIKFKTGIGGFKLAGDGPLKVPVTSRSYEVCIYLRKDKDFRTMPGGLNKIPVKGYSSVFKFSPGNTTLYWDPAGAGNDFRVRFYNNETAKRFRIKLEGMSYSGKVIHYETVVE